MTFRYLGIKHRRNRAVERWLDEERAEQEARFACIVEAMDDLAPRRKRWYAEFLERVQARGFNVDGDQRARIAAADIPVEPRRRDALRVVWRHGADDGADDADES